MLVGMADLRLFDTFTSWPVARTQLAGHLPAETIDTLAAAVTFAEGCHGEQQRPAGEPYVQHLLETADVLVNGTGETDADMLVAAVLHDVVEDTPCTLDEVRQRFGGRVADLVGWVTKPPAGAGQNKNAVTEAYLRRLRDAPVDAIRIKLAD